MWLIKTEPNDWSWDNQLKAGTIHWDGVRNYQAAQNLKKMRVGDLCFFYHTGKERRIMGIVQVSQAYELDPSDETGRFVMVFVKTVEAFKHPVSLKEVKADPALQHLALVRQSRLSVMPIDPEAWAYIIQLSSKDRPA